MSNISAILGGDWMPPQPVRNFQQTLADQTDLAYDALQSIPSDMPRDDWHKVGRAAIAAGLKIDDLVDWSRGAGNFKSESDVRAAFKTVTPEGGTGAGTLFKIASENGWRMNSNRLITRPPPSPVRPPEPARLPAPGMTPSEVFARGLPATDDHPYITSKQAFGVPLDGLRVLPACDMLRIGGDSMAGALVVPAYALDGTLQSLQLVPVKGQKMNLPGSPMAGASFTVGVINPGGVVYICEGIGAAWACWQATGTASVACFGWGNVSTVAKAIRKRDPSARLVICPDVGKDGAAGKIASEIGATVASLPAGWPDNSDVSDYAQAGHNLASLLALPVDDWLIPADDFCSQPAPIAWLVKHWIQADALIMVHGPSGGGKTFVVLDWCLHMAAGIPEWAGHKVKESPIVYLAGEGHHGLKSRIAAWKQHHRAGKLSMWLSRDGCDLNTAAGFLRVVESVRALRVKPSIIVVDTLHRFLHGDENSAQDAKGMLDACSALMREFSCSVILVHHTGVSEEAQHRGRGSSAWKGALEIEISIVPAKGDQPMQIVQRKAKDSDEAKPVFAELQFVPIDGWFDADGEQVTSAVVVEANSPLETKKDNKISVHIKTLDNAWWDSSAEVRSGAPYISRSGLTEYLIEKLGLSEASAKQYLKPSVPGKLISDLLLGGVIEAFESGWVILDNVLASSMMLRRGEM